MEKWWEFNLDDAEIGADSCQIGPNFACVFVCVRARDSVKGTGGRTLEIDLRTKLCMGLRCVCAILSAEIENASQIGRELRNWKRNQQHNALVLKNNNNNNEKS